MHDARGVFHVEKAMRKALSRFRRYLQVLRSQWPVISAIRPLYYLIRLFGLAPFEISGDHFIAGNYDVVYSLFCAVVQTYFAYHVLNRFVGIRRGSPIVDITETSKVIFNYFVALSNVVTAVWSRKEFIGVLNIVKDFDSRIRALGHPRKEGAAKIWSWSTCVCTVSLWITVSRISMVAFAEPWIVNITYLANYLVTSLSTIKFSSVVLLLGQRFQHLNEIAQRSKESATTRQYYPAIDFKAIQQLHSSLMNAGENLNSQYSWPLLLWLINLAVHSVSNVYFLINWVMVSPADWAVAQWAFVICIILWLIGFVAQLLLLHIACHFTSSEANRIGSIIINWKFLTSSRNYKVESLLHLINRKLSFSAAGCFCIDLPLLRSMTTLVTTYLILLLQFES